MKKVLVLGCTGSIGAQTLELVRAFPDRFSLAGVSAHTNRARLEAAASEFHCPACLTGGQGAGGLSALRSLIGSLAGEKDAIVVNGIAGSPGLLPSVWALEAGADLALANKETMVLAGPVITALARERGARIIPVDSEHSAIFHLLAGFGAQGVGEIILTASGGPFRTTATADLKRVTAADALRHPTWTMGSAITVDSATLANKGLEVIEAAYFFGDALGGEVSRIRVVVHPQSIVHSLVRSKSGVLYAQASPPDMRHPILAALSYPEVLPNALESLDLSGVTLSFEEVRSADFPMLPLAYTALKNGPAAAIAYSIGNETARSAFIAGKIAFTDISAVVEAVMAKGEGRKTGSIEEILDTVSFLRSQDPFAPKVKID